MKIDDWYPTPIEIIDCEFDTLGFFKDNFFCYQELSRLANHSNAYYSANYKRDKKSGFNFESKFNIKVDGKDGIAHIGSLIELNDTDSIDRTTYYAAICQEEKPNLLLRKYHFDYAPSAVPHRQPVFHLQYAGTLTPMLRKEDIDDEHLFPWLSEPRLCYFPLSLALLINFILKEFPDDNNFKLIEHPDWRRLIKKNENLILGPFFKGCQTFFSNNNTNKLFTNDFYYGN
jgi:hypothetical protein